MLPAIFLGLMLPQLGLCLAVLHKRPTPWRTALVHATLLGCGGVLVALLGLFGNLLFLPMQLLAWLLLLLWPVLLLGSARFLWSSHAVLSRAMGGLGAAILLVAAWSTGIEPFWLEVSHHRIESAKLDEELRIVLVADLQTDRMGRFERRVLERVVQEQGDLLLFAGDYLQPDDMEAFSALEPTLRAALEPACAQARLGCWAVRGDVDPDEWTTIFEPLNAEVVTASRSEDLGPLHLTALAPRDARSGDPPVPAVDAFHVVLGHAPDYALGTYTADLMLAGHVHGGQVRLPGFGPLLTLSQVPRGWASGRTDLKDGSTLIVSRGLGMERGDAPRVRFMCRPELVVIDLVAE